MGRDNEHWVREDYRQRMTSKEWKKLLLDKEDRLIFHGRVRQLKAKSLGAGVFEIYKEPLTELKGA